MKIVSAQEEHIEILSTIVSQSNQDVAELFKLSLNNAPKHPSFCTPEWIRTEFERGQRYFIYTDDGIAKGCVAFEQAGDTTAYLNRLSVLPAYRRKGKGSKLVSHVIEYSKEKEVDVVSIGTIAEHTQLTRWYEKLGFSKGAIQKFEHLPFKVLFMQYEIKNC